MRTGVCSTAWTRITGRSRRRLRKKEKKKIDKVRFFYLSLGRATRRACSRTRRRDARAPVSSAPISSAPVSTPPLPQARAMIEYHKCRVSSFSNWGKAASPEKLKHEAAVAALTAQIQLIELEASQRDPLF